MIVLCSDGPSAAAMMIASTSSGRACIISSTRCVTRSNQPSRYPDNRPTMTPMPLPSAIAPSATGERDARAVDDAAVHVAAHEIGAEPVLPARPRQRVRGVGRERVVHRDVRREGRGEQEQHHDHRAGRAKRVAAYEEADAVPARADIGAGRRQFGLKIGRAHVVPDLPVQSPYLMRGSSAAYSMSTMKFTVTTTIAMNMTRFCTIG